MWKKLVATHFQFFKVIRFGICWRVWVVFAAMLFLGLQILKITVKSLIINELNKMKFSEIQNNNVQKFLNTTEIIEETSQQIMKDFGMFGIVITFSGKTENAYEELHQQLIKIIGGLMQENYNKLLAVLYRIDITEKEIAKAEKDLPNYNLTEVVAHQIIMRELKKVLFRKYFNAK